MSLVTDHLADLPDEKKREKLRFYLDFKLAEVMDDYVSFAGRMELLAKIIENIKSIYGDDLEALNRDELKGLTH